MLKNKPDLVSLERLYIEEYIYKEAELKEIRYKSELYHLDKEILYETERIQNLEIQYRLLGLKNKLKKLLEDKEMLIKDIFERFNPEKQKIKEKLEKVQDFLYERSLDDNRCKDIIKKIDKFVKKKY